jgi:hypothetical protein
MESGIADFTGRKTGLNIPYWLAKLPADQAYPNKQRSEMVR